MLLRRDHIGLSASDLMGFLDCRHLTSLELAVARGTLQAPRYWDPAADLLRERGARHEAEFLAHLADQGLAVTHIPGVGVDADSVAATREAMQRGDPVIAQAALQTGSYGGRADVLRRAETPSALGDWSYEVMDTKLARTTKGGTILQLCVYSDLVADVQGVRPVHMHVVVPWSGFEPQTYRIADFEAYHRRVSGELLAAVGEGVGDTYPDPNPHCELCRWDGECSARRRKDDHLSLVAGISKLQIRELVGREVTTLADLAALPLPLTWRPERGSIESMQRAREQARIQLGGREAGHGVFEILPVQPGFGLARLPEPSRGDIFLDLEGDPFCGEGGLEYLFGYAWRDDDGGTTYSGDWSLSRTEERAAFERFIDFVVERRRRYPDLHIYHFAPYEPAALKRLMGRYASREEELDDLLRSQCFVDLYAVVRHALRASVESYSIKKLEPFYGYERVVNLTEANRRLARVQAALELGDPEAVADEDRAAVGGYNRDDCLSTWRLRDWLERLRAEQVAAGVEIARPPPSDSRAPESVTEWQARIEALVARLTLGIPDDPAERDLEQHTRWILAYILDWHRREQKAVWWEFFRLAELDDEELLSERSGLAGLTFAGRVGGTDRAPIHRYRFPPQDTDLRSEGELRQAGGERLGSLDAISVEERTIDIKKRGDCADLHPTAVFAHALVPTEVLAEALVRIGEHVADNGFGGDGPYRAARDLLLREPPRLSVNLQDDGEHAAHAAMRIAGSLEGGVLAIQGPPGTGKTFTGANMICTLVAGGAKVGVTANSHAVIENLMNEVLKTAAERGQAISCIEKVTDRQDDRPGLRFTTSNSAFFAAMQTECSVGAGTAWLWARPEAYGTLDVLVVDEAAQMSLANVLAVSHAARAVVLLGDPQQLDQPTKGSHPDGTDASALTHILGEEQTIRPGHGLFLEETWRLHPEICRFTSEVFYEGRLESRLGLEAQRVRSGNPRFDGAGLRYCPVDHQGNQSSSPEEATRVRELIDGILASGATWVDRDGTEAPVTLADILVIAPYNAQVFELQAALPGGIEIGTVDKFQGRQAAIVIYSMTTSTHADAPRGMEFLYSLNRLNVATSRAKCLCILVACPAVFDAECRTPRQMRLANAFCRYLEIATQI